jgi:PIN domain nuclease of toxin-antitoxin system
MKAVVADTHAAIWFLEDDKRLTRPALETLESADDIFLPSICLVEIIYLAEKGRLDAAVLPRILAELDQPNTTLRLAALDLGVVRALQGVSRNAVPDLPDRVVAATSLFYGAPLVTRDRDIRGCGIETIW